jgi:hypothetical protein
MGLGTASSIRLIRHEVVQSSLKTIKNEMADLNNYMSGLLLQCACEPVRFVDVSQDDRSIKRASLLVRSRLRCVTIRAFSSFT